MSKDFKPYALPRRVNNTHPHARARSKHPDSCFQSQPTFHSVRWSSYFHSTGSRWFLFCAHRGTDGHACTQTASGIQRATLENTIWASLCQREWPNTSTFPWSFVEEKGYRWLYRH